MSFSEKPLPPKQFDDAVADNTAWEKALANPKNEFRTVWRLAIAAFAVGWGVTVIGVLVMAINRSQRINTGMMMGSNMSQMALAVHNCHDVNKTIPPYNGPYGSRTAAPY